MNLTLNFKHDSLKCGTQEKTIMIWTLEWYVSASVTLMATGYVPCMTQAIAQPCWIGQDQPCWTYSWTQALAQPCWIWSHRPLLSPIQALAGHRRPLLSPAEILLLSPAGHMQALAQPCWTQALAQPCWTQALAQPCWTQALAQPCWTQALAHATLLDTGP